MSKITGSLLIQPSTALRASYSGAALLQPVIAPFLLSRFTVLGVAVFVQWLLDAGRAHKYTFLIGDEPLATLSATWDARAYGDIALRGYDTFADPTRMHNYHFFPLYPLLMRVFGDLTGLGGLHGGYNVAGVLLSHGFFLFALALLYKLTLSVWPAPPFATSVVWIVSALPWAYSFSMAYTESLFLLLSVGAMFVAHRVRARPTTGAIPLSGLLVGLAALTRPQGIIVLLPVLMLLCVTPPSLPIRARARNALLAALPTGLFVAGFASYIAQITGTGNLLTVAQDNRNWGDGWFPVFLQFLGTKPDTGNLAWVVGVLESTGLLVWLALTTALVFLFVRMYGRNIAAGFRVSDNKTSIRATGAGATVQARSGAGAFVLYAVVYLLYTAAFSPSNSSWGRYMAVIFPCAWALARFTTGDRARVRFFAISMVFQAVLYAAAILYQVTP